MVGGEVFQMWPATLSRPEESVRSLPSGPDKTELSLSHKALLPGFALRGAGLFWCLTA